MGRREIIEARLQETPDDVFLNYTYALELAKGDDLEAARAAFLKVRELDSNNVPAYFQEGQMLAAFGEIEEARAILTEGIAIAVKVGDSHAHGEMSEFLASL